MLFLFGRYGEPAKIAAGIVLAAIGIALHTIVLTVIGGVLLLWGAGKLLTSARRGGQRTRQPHGGAR